MAYDTRILTDAFVFVHRDRVNPDRSERLVDLLDGLALSQLLIPAQEMEGRMRKRTVL